MKPTYRKSWAENLLMCSDLTWVPPLRSNEESSLRIGKFKSAFSSLIIGPRGLQI